MDGNLKNRHFFTPDVNKSVVNTVAVYYKYMYVTVSILTGSNRRTFTAFSGTGCHLNLILYIQHTHASSTSFHTKYGVVGLKRRGRTGSCNLRTNSRTYTTEEPGRIQDLNVGTPGQVKRRKDKNRSTASPKVERCGMGRGCLLPP